MVKIIMEYEIGIFILLLTIGVVLANHEAIIELNTYCEASRSLEAINCKGTNGSIKILEVVMKRNGNSPNNDINKELFVSFTDMCNTLEICKKDHTDIFKIIRMGCKKVEAAAKVIEIDIKFECDGASVYPTPDGGSTLPTTTKPSARTQLGPFPIVMICLSIFTVGAVFACAVIYIINNCKTRKSQSDFDEYADDGSTYAEIDYSQVSSTSATPEPPMPPSAGTPHPIKMPLYSTAREPGSKKGASRWHSSRRKFRPSKKQQDQPPNFLPPDPETQSTRVFRLRAPPQPLKKNTTTAELNSPEIDDTLLEENCFYDYGGSCNNPQMSPLQKADDYIYINQRMKY